MGRLYGFESEQPRSQAKRKLDTEIKPTIFKINTNIAPPEYNH